MQAQLIRHLRCTHRIWQILLIRKYKKHGIAKLVLVQHSMHLITGGIDTVRIVRVHNEDESLGILVVVSPERTDLILTTDIPHGERDVLVFDSFDVETDGGDRCYNYFTLQQYKKREHSIQKPIQHKRTNLITMHWSGWNSNAFSNLGVMDGTMTLKRRHRCTNSVPLSYLKSRSPLALQMINPLPSPSLSL